MAAEARGARAFLAAMQPVLLIPVMPDLAVRALAELSQMADPEAPEFKYLRSLPGRRAD